MGKREGTQYDNSKIERICKNNKKLKNLTADAETVSSWLIAKTKEVAKKKTIFNTFPVYFISLLKQSLTRIPSTDNLARIKLLSCNSFCKCSNKSFFSSWLWRKSSCYCSIWLSDVLSSASMDFHTTSSSDDIFTNFNVRLSIVIFLYANHLFDPMTYYHMTFSQEEV